MREKNNQICENCGFDPASYRPEANVANVPSVLNGRYLVGLPLGKGGFGITYIAYDLKIGGICAIKEYLPDMVSFRAAGEQNISVSESRLEDYRYGLGRFIEEARMLMKFSKSRNIINVFDCFEENNTAYYVMEYLKGHDLRTHADGFRKRLDPQFGLKCMLQVMDGLEELHRQDIIHRDISPDNIYITHTSEIKLLDFGAARYSMTQQNRQLSVILKMGYAPPEQYGSKIQQGPWTDIYALGATFYHLFSGEPLPEATDRTMGEPVADLRQVNPSVPEVLSHIIHKAVSLNTSERFRSIAEMRTVLSGLYNTKPVETETAENISIAETAVSCEKSNFEPGIEPGMDSKSDQTKDNLIGLRISACAIDLMIPALIFIALFSLGAALDDMGLLYGSGRPILLTVMFSSPILFLLANINLECSKWMGTVGKRITGLRTMALDGSTLSPTASIKRNLLKFLGVLLLLTEKNGTYLHDRLAGSRVHKLNK
jgi:serine/threonine protein kinase